MQLKKVEISGFKSFLDRTCFQFQPGVTAVVGPNGCGKSNIVDAIRWAMGEQSAKALRGQIMEDVIFNGSDVHHPMGMAEVILTFANTNGNAPPHLTGCEEIEVCRRLFRSGESEYTINRVPCRRRDVWELFMDTGLGNRSYAIVEQDRVARIIHSKPEERRVIIEEVAGISKYRARREAAQRKMEATRQNLIRVQDVRRELGQQIQGLERQARKAERFRELRRRVMEAERGVQLRKWADLHCRELAIEEECKRLASAETDCKTGLQVEEASLEGERLSLLQRERALRDAQEEAFRKENEVHSMEARARSDAQEIQRLGDLGAVLKGEIADLEGRIGKGHEEKARLFREMARLRQEKSEAERTEGQIRSMVQGLRDQRDRLVSSLEERKSQLVEWLSERATLRNSKIHHQRQAEEVSRFLERNQQDQRALEERMHALRTSLDEAVARVRQMVARLEELNDRRSALSGRLQVTEAKGMEARAILDATRSEIQEARSRLEGMAELQRSLEGFSEGVKTLRSLSEGGGLLGHRPMKVVAEVMEVSEGAEAAVSGLLGERLQSLVVEDLEDALEALAVVREKGLGRVSFVALRGKEGAGSSDQGGEWGMLAREVRWESGYAPLAGVFFSDVEVVEGAREALDLWRSNGHSTLVTRQGEVLSPAGIFEGGERRDASAGYLKRRREIRSLEGRIKLLAEEETGHRRVAQELESETSALKQELESVRQEIHLTEIQLAEGNKEIKVLEEALGTAQQRRELLRWEAEERSQELLEVQALLAEEQGRLDEMEASVSEAERELNAMEGRRQRLQGEIDQLREELTKAQVELASVGERLDGHQREARRLEERIGELMEEKGRKEALLWDGIRKGESLGEGLRQMKEELQALIEGHRASRETVQALQREIEEKRASLVEREKSLVQQRRRTRELEQALQELRLEQREVALRREHLEGDLTGRLEMALDSIPEAAAGLAAVVDDYEETRLAELKDSLAKMGDVNLTAVEQYEELKARYDFLTGQQEDLEESIRSLQKAIQRINRASRRRFREAFAAVDEQFRKVFPLLFTGGEARLVLTEGPDVLDAGVEIVARPPGKRLQSMSLLSGGEKALTAVALIFAMIMIKPPPFCLMDEVDAPLDDANIDRFNQMVKELSKGSQFVLVTHNKRTMEMADILYGITMETPGVSKLISVRLQ